MTVLDEGVRLPAILGRKESARDVQVARRRVDGEGRGIGEVPLNDGGRDGEGFKFDFGNSFRGRWDT